jgi:hypothetical protein
MMDDTVRTAGGSKRLLMISSILCAIALGAWCFSVVHDGGPYHVSSDAELLHDGLRWHRFYVLRLRPSHVSLEIAEVSKPWDATFATDLRATRDWGVHAFSNFDWDLGVIGWNDYRSGVATMSGSQSTRRSRKPTTIPVVGHQSVGIRWWFLMVMAGLPAAHHYVRVLRMRWRPAPGVCRKCGYDLRATPDRCPECGTVPNGIKLITSPRRH